MLNPSVREVVVKATAKSMCKMARENTVLKPHAPVHIYKHILQ
jgi:hypothetical protein